MWAPAMTKVMPQKKYEHRALDDIKESIEELRYYKEHLWNIPAGTEDKDADETGVTEITEKIKETSLGDDKGE
jgi:hypothetical protein